MANTYATGFETIGGLRYLINTDAKTATLVADTVKYYGDIVVPEKVTLAGIDYPVIEFARECFKDCNSLTSITIPESVTSLGSSCFYGCSSLTSITIPSSVTSLREGCFFGCSSLASITIPSSVTSLGTYCFSGCSSLTSITIPSSVTSLGDRCFYGCSSLASITIPSSVTRLEILCFYGCSSLTSITIPSSVTSLREGCFWGCTSLISITIPSSVTSLGSDCFYGCSSLTSITIPSSVISLGTGCFYGCSSLTSITIPSSVEKIVSWSGTSRDLALFGNCGKLESVYCYAVTPPTSSQNNFGLSPTTILYVPSTSINKYKQATGWKDFIAILPISGTESDTKGKCEKPSITFTNGKLHFESSTTGANYHYTITSNDMKTEAYSENGDVSLMAAYNITAYATAEEYQPSDKATATLYWVDGRIDDPTGISSTTSAKRGIVVSSQNGTVTLSGLDDGERVSFYSVSGSSLGTVKASHGVATGSFPQGQVVIVKVGKDSMKVAL